MLSHSTIRRRYDQGLDSVLRLITRLEDQITQQQAQLTRNPQPLIASLAKELARTTQTLARRDTELLEQQQLNQQLLQRLRELEHEVERAGSVGRDSHNSSFPPSSDPPWQKVPRTRGLRQKSGLKVGGQPQHRGPTLRQTHRPDHLITHAAASCSGCGYALREMDAVRSDRRQVFDLPEVCLLVTEHHAVTRRCPLCGAETQAAFPAGLRATVQYGPGLLARAAYLNLYQLLPLARTAEAMRDLFGCPVSLATVERAGRFSSGKLVGS
jgi:transposase